MNFYTSGYVKDDYGAIIKTKRVRLTEKAYWNHLYDMTNNLTYTVDTRIGWWYWSAHVMVLDCDSTEALVATCHVLKLEQIGYAMVESSPEHYWVITDQIGKFGELYELAKRFPGVDPDYLKLCGEHNKFFLRACTKKGALPIFGDCDLKNPRVKCWYNEFRKLYESHKMQRFWRIRQVWLQYEAGQIMEMAKDPKFDV